MAYISDGVTPNFENLSRQRKREIILSKTNHRCAYCGVHQDDIEGYLFLDHMTPRIKGGSNAKSNLIVACRTCNNRKSKKTVEEFRKHLHMGVESHIKNAIAHMDSHSRYMTTESYQAVIDSLSNVLVIADEESRSDSTVFYMDMLGIGGKEADNV